VTSFVVKIYCTYKGYEFGTYRLTCLVLLISKKVWIEWNPEVSTYCEEEFPFEDWDAFPGLYCTFSKELQAFKEHWIECGAYDPKNKIWSEEKMNIHLNKLYYAERGLAKCLERLRNSGQLQIEGIAFVFSIKQFFTQRYKYECFHSQNARSTPFLAPHSKRQPPSPHS